MSKELLILAIHHQSLLVESVTHTSTLQFYLIKQRLTTLGRIKQNYEVDIRCYLMVTATISDNAI